MTPYPGINISFPIIYEEEEKPVLEMKYFVLNPLKENMYGVASRSALRTYADAISGTDEALAKDITRWVDGISGRSSYVPTDRFVTEWRRIQREVHQTAIDKGFTAQWKRLNHSGLRDTFVALKLALIHSEISEALEAVRHGNPPDDKIVDYTGAEAELADAVIRIMDLAALMGWDVAKAIITKSEYNKTRDRMHGGKRF